MFMKLAFDQGDGRRAAGYPLNRLPGSTALFAPIVVIDRSRPDVHRLAPHEKRVVLTHGLTSQRRASYELTTPE
jgi:hypothetical protein